MHDPCTQAHQIRWPWPRKGYREPILTIWHKDPEKDGTDDSCGWFMRERHGDPKVLERIVRDFEFDWDRTYEGDNGYVYNCGWFRSDGQPHFSPIAIAVGMFHRAAGLHFAKGDAFDWDAAERFMRKHLGEIIRFAENPTDSMHDSLTLKFEVGCGEYHTPERRKRRIRQMASMVYGWILRECRPWWKHPRWHIHHWQIQFHPWQNLKRRFWDRCCVCGKRGFPKGESAIGNWDSDKIWHSSCDKHLRPNKNPVT